MFTAAGTLTGPVGDYRVTWDNGALTGTQGAVDSVLGRVGTEVLVAPVGPTYTVDVTDPASVLATLMAYGQVDELDGDVPDVVPPIDDTVCY